MKGREVNQKKINRFATLHGEGGQKGKGKKIQKVICAKITEPLDMRRMH